MLKSIDLKRFRSILDADITLSGSGFTVLVGSNGSGKTNFIKALNFISTMNRDGLQSAIIKGGAREGILSKAISLSQAKRLSTIIEYENILGRPEYYPQNFPPPSVKHKIEIEWQSPTKYRIKNESFIFTEVITVGKCLRLIREESLNKRAKSNQIKHIPSSILFTRNEKGSIDIHFKPERPDNNITDFLNWVGPPVIEGVQNIDTSEDLKSFFRRLFFSGLGRHEREDKLDKTNSIVDPEINFAFAFIPQMLVFRRLMRNTKRYDLQLSELRQEQKSSVRGEMGTDGSNLPSAFRKLREKKRGKLTNRIMETLCLIAPEISKSTLRTLKNGKELIEFIESKSGRPVEQWNSADGTLRALAILVAVETHPENGTLLIEEPERCLHPWAIPYVINHIRQIIEERYIQVVLTTHSEHVLACTKPDELFVLERDRRKGTQINPLENVAPMHTMNMGDVGRLWVQGLLGGVPKYEK